MSDSVKACNRFGLNFFTPGLLVWILVVCFFAGAEIASGSEKTPIALSNPHFESTGEGESKTIRDWTFEAIEFQYRGKGIPVGIALSTNEHGKEADFTPSGAGDGVLLKCTTETGRGDLYCAPLDLDSFTWIEVSVEFSIESGKPLVFASLRPVDDRKLQDIAFFSCARLGKKVKSSVLVHTGVSDGPYQLSVSITCKGTARLRSIEACVTGKYEKPEQPIFVLDIGHDDPLDSYDECWQSIRKLLTVYGFPSIEFIHYTEFTREKLEAIDPGLILLSPLFGGITKQPDMEAMVRSHEAVMDYGVPMIGICAGHQSLARLFEGAEYGGKQEEWEPTRLRIVKKDPLFDDLPRAPYFRISESHNYAVKDAFPACDLLATSKTCKAQIFKYKEKPWYTFQGHIESLWDSCCPEACVLWRNLLRELGYIKVPEKEGVKAGV